MLTRRARLRGGREKALTALLREGLLYLGCSVGCYFDSARALSISFLNFAYGCAPLM
jgi:hypothetical protein